MATKTKKSPRSPLEASLRRFLLPALAAIFVFTLYFNLGRDPLFDWDEGIYAELGRNLLSDLSLFTPSWNGEIWLEKPPGIAWISALGMLLGGINPFGARLFMPLFAGATIIGIYLIGRKIGGSVLGLLSALFLANMNLFLSRARALNTDGVLLTGIVWTVYLLMTKAKPLTVALAVSLSVWVKGIAGLLPLLISFPLLIDKKPSYIKRILIYLFYILSPWHIYQLLLRKNVFYQPYLEEQVLRRITTPIEFHLESRWFYFRFLLENLGLGMIIVLSLSLIFLIHRIFFRRPRTISVLLVWWILVPTLVFTASKTRLFWYILPIYPALALACGYLLWSLGRGKHGKNILVLFLFFYSLYTLQGVSRSVEVSRRDSVMPERIQAAQYARSFGNELSVLVPETERIAEAVLPYDQRISSSFRYGGMPSVVFYFGGRVKFFYNVDEFLSYLKSTPSPVSMIHAADSGRLLGLDELQDFGEYKIVTRSD